MRLVALIMIGYVHCFDQFNLAYARLPLMLIMYWHDENRLMVDIVKDFLVDIIALQVVTFVILASN